jgi:hypothetical protein
MEHGLEILGRTRIALLRSQILKQEHISISTWRVLRVDRGDYHAGLYGS